MMNMTTALSALRASQVGLQVVGNNIANANTPGYHRQELRLLDGKPVEIQNLYMGQGVEIADIHRAYDQATENAITQNIAEQATARTMLQASREIEAMVIPGQGTVLDRLEQLFNDLERLTATPDNAATRSIVIGSAQNLAESINQLARGLHDMTRRIDETIDAKLDFIRDKTGEIGKLNEGIRQAEIRGQAPNDLKDRRDVLINELSEVIDVEVTFQKTAGLDVNVPETVLRIADGQLATSRNPLELRTTIDPSGDRIIIKDGLERPIEVTSGELGGLLRARNEIVGFYQDQLEEFTQGLAKAFDATHANGIGIRGSFTTLAGRRLIDETAKPLAEIDTVVPVQAGELYVSIIDPAGQRTLHSIAIDPTVDSLEDVAARISAIDHLEARVDDPPGQLSFRAEAGYQFDFLTNQPVLADTSAITGTVQPRLSGQYSGATNDTYEFEFESTGTVGVTPDLMLVVRDKDGALVGEFDVGQGYSPGSNLTLGHGVTLSISPGDVNLGDRFTVDLIQSADSSNLLVATGTNTLFEGQSALTLGVRRDLLTDADLFAVTLSGDPLDARNAENLMNLRYREFMDGGTETLEENFQAFVSTIGAQVRDLSQTEETLAVIEETLVANRDSISGVDPNEEAVRMLQFQRSFQAAARYITTLDETMQELMNIIR